MLVEWVEEREPRENERTDPDGLIRTMGFIVASHRTLFGRHMLTIALPSGEIREVPARDCKVAPVEAIG